MKIILSVLLLIGLSIGACAKPIIIGKDQAPINAHDYAVLKKVAENAQFPVEKFRHLNKKRNDHFIVGPEGFLYDDDNKNGLIDGEDKAVFGGISRASNSYITDKKGFVVALKIKKTKFNDSTLLNGFKHIVAINLFKNEISDLNISNLAELRFLNIFEPNSLRVMTQLSNVNKLAFFEVSGLNTPNFKKFTGVKGLQKIEISGMGIKSFAGLENMPNLKEAIISTNSKKLTSLAGIPKGHKLEKLKLSTSVTSDIKGIANFTHLKQLELWAKKRTLTDYTPLNKLKNLEELEISTSNLSDFSFIDDMPKLKKIITYAPINSLAGVSNAPNLQHLELQRGTVRKIEHLDKNPQLKTLIINNHKLTKLEGLSKLKKLNTLDVSRNNITEIEGLENNQCLEKLWLAANPIKTLDNVYHLPLLRQLGLSDTEINEFPRWQELKRLFRLSVDKQQLKPEQFTSGYFYVNIPIKDFDLQLQTQREFVITSEESIKYGCI